MELKKTNEMLKQKLQPKSSEKNKKSELIKPLTHSSIDWKSSRQSALSRSNVGDVQEVHVPLDDDQPKTTPSGSEGHSKSNYRCSDSEDDSDAPVASVPPLPTP